MKLMEHKLKDRRVAVLAADGFEMVELAVPVAALRLAGATVEVVSLRHGRIRGVNLHEPASRVGVDKTVDEADPAEYDALLLPGGFINPDLLRQSQQAREFVRAFDAADKPIATLCHGAWLLASAGLLAGRTLTSWPGIRDDLVNAGATWLDQEVVRDGNLVTSRGPQDMKPFVEGDARTLRQGGGVGAGRWEGSGSGGIIAAGQRASVRGPRSDALDAAAFPAHAGSGGAGLGGVRASPQGQEVPAAAVVKTVGPSPAQLGRGLIPGGRQFLL